jgi:uncharacterized protein (TIGR00255 family)
MTAFASASGQCEGVNFIWEVRSVNQRFLDVYFRLPEAFRALEGVLRTKARDTIGRGKLECFLKIETATAQVSNIKINNAMVNALVAEGALLSESIGIANDLSLSNLLGLPGVVVSSELHTEAFLQQVALGFDEALQALRAMRLREGEGIKAVLAKRLEELDVIVDAAKLEAHHINDKVKTKLYDRLQALDLTVAEGRIEQEIALMLTRLDVCEELDRLSLHIEEVSRLLTSHEAVGRRLDFLMQELNREANTLSSKSESIELTQYAVSMKVLIEQMREQIQNIE